MSRLGVIAAGVAVVLAGSVGYAGGIEEGKKSAPATEPERIVETETVVEKVDVEVSPPECVEAIRLAREGFDLSARFANVMHDFLMAASEFDVRNMERHTAKIDPLTDEIEELAPEFNANANACEAAES